MSEKLKILYLIGAGNSGTTILSMALGAHPNMVSVGELSHISRFKSNPQKLCSCSEEFQNCEFWSQLDIKQIGDITPFQSLKEVYTKHQKQKPLSDGEKAVIDNNVKLYQGIARISRKNIIIDASKDMRRLRYLFKSADLEIITLYMVRDVRAYTDSYLRRGGKSIVKGLLRWLKLNAQTILGITIFGIKKKILHISFQQFTENTEETMKTICETLDVAYDDEILSYHRHKFHNLAGTNSRFNLRPIQPVESWRKRMDFKRKLIYTLCGGWLFNIFFGVFRK